MVIMVAFVVEFQFMQGVINSAYKKFILTLPCVQKKKDKFVTHYNSIIKV